MRYEQDKNGLFYKIPYFAPAEIEEKCWKILLPFIQGRRGSVTFPVTTDDIAVLIEQYVDDLDMYADLSHYGHSIEGVTIFQIDQQPRVAIAKRLSEFPHLRHRLKTTLTHEFGHVLLHTGLYISGSLTPRGAASQLYSASEGEMEKQTSWMEWQAWQAAACMLLPKTEVLSTLDTYLKNHGRRSITDLRYGYIPDFIKKVAKTFDVSEPFAKRRLVSLNIIPYS